MSEEPKEDKRMTAKVPDEAQETPEDFDPMLAQADRMPAFLRGSAGAPDHVRAPDQTDEEDFGDEEFGLSSQDPSTFTGD